MKDKEYNYLIVFAIEKGGTGNTEAALTKKLSSMKDVERLQNNIEKSYRCGPVVVTNFILLGEE